MLIVRLFVSYADVNHLCHFFLFLLVSGVDCDFCLWLFLELSVYFFLKKIVALQIGPRQANLVLIAYANSEGSGEPAHPRSLARTSAARSYKQ